MSTFVKPWLISFAFNACVSIRAGKVRRTTLRVVTSMQWVNCIRNIRSNIIMKAIQLLIVDVDLRFLKGNTTTGCLKTAD